VDRWRGIGVLTAVWLLLPRTVTGVTVFSDGETKLDIGVLLQPLLQLSDDGAPDGESIAVEIYARRLRLIVSGSVTQRITFFLETDQPNFGRQGDFAAPMFMQDAFVTFRLNPSVWVDAGLMLLPFTHNGLQSASRLNALDYHAGLFPYPAGSHKVFRDGGFQLRGLVARNRVHFRLGVFQGVRGRAGERDTATGVELAALNPSGRPRVAGTVRCNLFGSEEGFFFGGMLFSELPVVSLGVSGLYQSGAVRTTAGIADQLGLAADVYADLPLDAEQELVVLAGYHHSWQGAGAPGSGIGFLGELGYRWRWLGPVVSYDWFQGEAGTADLRSLRVGLNAWVKRHTFNVKSELARTESGDLGSPATRIVTTFSLQTQVAF
jgi:hypothetical protein